MYNILRKIILIIEYAMTHVPQKIGNLYCIVVK